MRYTRLQTVTSKVFDGYITETPEIIALLTSIKDQELTCELTLTSLPPLKNTRIIAIGDGLITWQHSSKVSTYKQSSPFEDIVSITVHTNSNVATKLKQKVSRWQLLDI